jgi:predicted metal-binding membrane protein
MSGGMAPPAFASFMAMWVVMMLGMMLPPLVPALARYRRSLHGSAVPLGPPTALVGAGYYLVWSAAGLVAYGAGAAVAAAEHAWPGLGRLVPVATGAVLLVAGAVQLTPWKRGHLARCRECTVPESPDAWQAGRHGVHLGVQCVLCCTGFMIVLLATGMMRLGTIALVAGAITVERVVPWPDRTARALGVTILAVGTFVLVRGLGTP